MAAVDLWLPWGQSNMQGRGDSTLSPATDPALAWEWVEGTGLITLADPTSQPSTYASLTGSMLPAFANTFTTTSERPSVFIPSAVGGTALLAASKPPGAAVWGYGGTLYTDAITRTQQAIAGITSAGHTVAGINILWHQGEADGANYPTPADLPTVYRDALIDLHTRARTDLAAPDLTTFVCRLGRRFNNDATTWVHVRTAQDAACAETEGMVMAYTRCVDFFDLGWMQGDNLHYNQAGLNDMGASSAQLALSALGYGVDPPPETPARPRTSRCARRLLDII